MILNGLINSRPNFLSSKEEKGRHITNHIQESSSLKSAKTEDSQNMLKKYHRGNLGKEE